MSSNNQSPTRKALKRLYKNKMAMFGIVWIALISILALCAPLISSKYMMNKPHDEQVLAHKNLPPSWWTYSESDKKRLKFENLSQEQLAKVQKDHSHNMDNYWLGTDSLGRDLFIRNLYGARISLLVAIIGTAVSLIIGVTWGAIAGYVGKWVDEVMMRFVDILYALPYLFFVIMIMTLVERSITMMFVCIGAISWLTMSRIVRGEVISLKERDYVIASQALGGEQQHILTKHILPNILGIIIIYSTLMVPQIILTETFLSWLGLGLSAKDASWGNLMAEGATTTAMSYHSWKLIFPGITLSLTLLALNFLGDGLRDAFDPRQSR